MSSKIASFFKSIVSTINGDNINNNNNNKSQTSLIENKTSTEIENINNNNTLVEHSGIINNMMEDDNSSSTTTVCNDNSEAIAASLLNQIEDNNIEWPIWCKDYEFRNDLRAISRNGLDDTTHRLASGFKGENFVYQNTKFISKLYWKGKSPIFGDEEEDSEIITSKLNIRSSYNGIVNDDDDRMLYGVIYWKNTSEGPPGCVHGGALASLFDDSMACCIRYFYNNNFDDLNLNKTKTTDNSNNDIPIPKITISNPQNSKTYVVTANLSVNYKKFVVLESFSMVETRIQKRDGKKIYISSTIKDQYGVVRADATAIWIVVKIDTPINTTSSPPSFLSPSHSPTLIPINNNNNSSNNDNSALSTSLPTL